MSIENPWGSAGHIPDGSGERAQNERDAAVAVLQEEIETLRTSLKNLHPDHIDRGIALTQELGRAEEKLRRLQSGSQEE